MSIFHFKYYSRHLMLEIALAIPASNDEKYKQTIQEDKGSVSIGLTFCVSWRLLSQVKTSRVSYVTEFSLHFKIIPHISHQYFTLAVTNTCTPSSANVPSFSYIISSFIFTVYFVTL